VFRNQTAKRDVNMDKHDIIRYMKRFPDKITTKKMMGKTWKCSTCQTEFNCEYGKMPIPAPCNRCGGIFFEKLS